MEANGADRADLRNRFPEIHPPSFHNITGNGRDAKLTKQIFLSEPRTSIVNIMRATVVSPVFQTSSGLRSFSVSLLIAYNKFLFRIRIGNIHVFPCFDGLEQDYEKELCKIIIFFWIISLSQIEFACWRYFYKYIYLIVIFLLDQQDSLYRTCKFETKCSTRNNILLSQI